jgi:DDE superfamily endonuclease
VKGKRNEEAFQRDKECLAAFKQQENDGELALYYFDESGFSTTPSVPYGWQRIGETRRIPCHRSKRMNVLGFLSRSNDLFFHTAEQAVTTDTVVAAFDAFVEGYASKHQETGIPCLVVLDNASIHRSGMFKEKLTGWLERGVRVYFLPPYSPELNLIEILWRKIKYEWLPFDAYQSYGHLKKWVLEILGNVGVKFQITFV